MGRSPHVASVTYRVTHQSALDARLDLLRLWRDNLSPSVPLEARFDWMYRTAPAASSVVLMLEASADKGATVVGTNGVVPRVVRIAGRDLRGGISCDLAVDRDHRALAPALALVRAVRADVGPRFDVVYGFPNAKAEGVLKRTGFHQLGRARRWVKVLRYRRYVAGAASRLEVTGVARWLSQRPALANAVAAVADTASALGARLLRLPQYLVFVTSVVASPPETLDGLWTEARDEYPIIGDRSRAFVSWRFAMTPATRFVTIRRRGASLPDAYAAVEQDHDTGALHIRDLFGHRPALGALVDAVLAFAWRAGASSVSVRFLGAPDVEGHLTARGFTPRGESRCVVVAACDAVPDHAAIEDAARWHLFDVDEES